MLSSKAKIAIVLLTCLVASSALSAPVAPGQLSGSLIGFVGDNSGVPQMGAAVLLYNGYDRVIGKTLTNEKGAFGFESLLPGVYSIRVSLASFVTAAKEQIRVEPGVRNFLSINLASVLSSVELVYSAPGQTAIMSDDWEWVLAHRHGQPARIANPPRHRHRRPGRRQTRGSLNSNRARFPSTTPAPCYGFPPVRKARWRPWGHRATSGHLLPWRHRSLGRTSYSSVAISDTLPAPALPRRVSARATRTSSSAQAPKSRSPCARRPSVPTSEQTC